MKRLFDVFSAAMGLLVLAPVLAAVALAIKMESRGPVFYRGLRAGRHGKPFRIFKFRTMVMNADRRESHFRMSATWRKK
jgi:lipopolysaccharide/colanic/teichoic acid biosynthesis glycosyltransferase